MTQFYLDETIFQPCEIFFLLDENLLKDKKQVFPIQKPYHIITMEHFNQFVIIMVPKLAIQYFKKRLKDIKTRDPRTTRFRSGPRFLFFPGPIGFGSWIPD